MKKYLILLIAGLLLIFSGFAIFVHHKNKTNKEQVLEANYKKGLEPNCNSEDFFCPEAQYAKWDSVSKYSKDEGQKLLAARFKSVLLLRMGQEKQAISLLEELIRNAAKDSSGRITSDAYGYLALAFLRLAERNNCITNHSSGSCVFPIRDSGIYSDPAASDSAIRIYQQILSKTPNDLDARWLLNLAYMTIGEYPAKVPAEWIIRGLDSSHAKSEIAPFQEIAGNLHLNSFRNMSGGSIVDDFDNDGYLDIVTSSMSLNESMHYFRNNGDGTFTDASKTSGLDKVTGGLNIIQADYNNDGYPDILVLRGAWMQQFGTQPVSLLKNNGNGTFSDVTVESNLISFAPTQTATWADFNNDGWLDLYIGYETTEPGHPHPAALFINNRDGSFTEVGKEAGCDIVAFEKGVVSADYNNDGWPDIFISSLDGHKTLLKNKGVRGKIPQFENATHEAGLDANLTYTFPTWFWDYDNDGFPDIFACGYEFDGSLAKTEAAVALGAPVGKVSKMYLYRNNGDGTFSDVSRQVGLDIPVFAMGSNFGDFDNDGWLDMYLGTGNPDLKSLVPNKLFKNINGRQFEDVTVAARVGNLQKGHGVAFADLDNDGDQDIFIEVGGPFKGDAYFNSLYLNPGQNKNNSISILLVGKQSNRSAIGARIAVRVNDRGFNRTIYRDVNSGGSFGASPLRQEIGIGAATTVDEISIQWPGSGKTQIFKNVPAKQFIKITEGSDQIEKMELKTLKFPVHHEMMNMGYIDCDPKSIKANPTSLTGLK